MNYTFEYELIGSHYANTAFFLEKQGWQGHYSRNDAFFKHENIYSGLSGVILFLIELYKKKKNEQILSAIDIYANHLIHHCKSNPPKSFTFYLGRLGTVYTLIRVYKLTNNIYFLNQALSLLNEIGHTNIYDTTGFYRDLMTGTCGILHGLLLIQNEIEFDGFEQLVLEGVNILLKELQVGVKGIYWQRNPLTIRPLCGLAHGAAGYGLLFYELGKIFKNQCFYYIGSLAFEYENFYYSESFKEWPDFRLNEHGNTEKHLELFKAGAISELVQPKYQTAWCHGSVGIGLSRFRAYAIEPDKQYLSQAIAASDRAIQMSNLLKPGSDLSLCHGLSGIGILLQQAFHTTRDVKYLNALNALLQKIQNSFSLTDKNPANIEQYPDHSLFTGLAGIGYLYLSLNDSEMFHILCPTIDFTYKIKVSSGEPLMESVDSFTKLWANKIFPRTLAFLRHVSPSEYVNLFINGNIQASKISLMGILKAIPETLKGIVKKQYLEILKIEERIISIEDSLKSHNLLMLEKTYYKSVLDLQTPSLINNDNLKKMFIKKNPNISFLKTQWQWNKYNVSIEFPIPSSQGNYTLMLMPNSLNILEIYISQFTYQLLKTFHKGMFVDKGIYTLLNQFDSTGDGATILEQTIKQQIIECLKSGMLVIDKT